MCMASPRRTPYLPRRREGAGRQASPYRRKNNGLVKLYKVMSKDQHKMIGEVNFDGLLKIACATIPSDFANWQMECFDAESSELVFPGRGRISMTAESVADIPNLLTRVMR
jgi:hypothetical protein